MQTDLQRKLSTSVERLLKERNVTFKLETLAVAKQYFHTPTPGEVYLRYDFTTHNRVYEVFIYSNEAGFYRDKRWIAFERGAYAREEDLVDAFVRRMSAELANPSE